jgi:excisionase family DNA binding protein
MTAPAQDAAADKALAAYLTSAQVAELLQVSEKSVYRWVKADPSMPALRLGGTVRFPRERLERWLREREQGRPPMRRRVHSIAESRTSTAGEASCAESCAEGGRK